ncbi:MAG: RNA polymerase-associated protein RapA [Proteobacteria bacterium]|nr:RNA polymerase-associated protein RapA [Pseudomonadota bacterium]
MNFIAGQRFINNADIQLGLGRVIAENHRMVRIIFDAVGEERTYAKDTAPLSRYVFHVGDQVQHKDGWKITVTEVKDLNGLNIYFGLNESGDEDVVPETEITNTISLDRPTERLLNGQVDKYRWFSLRQSAQQHKQRLQQSELYGLIGCRTVLLPHQLYIAHSVGKRYAPRVLLADEVGLGKTIEACLIVHQQLLTGRAKRVIIIVPESLTHQWMVEMLRRFNLQVSVFDEEKCQEIAISSGIDNPFDSAQIVLLPLEMVTENPLREEQINASDWDWMVVDEAHHLHWSEDDDATEHLKGVKEYNIIEGFASQIPGVLLLTATPEQLGKKSHFARLRILDSNRYHDFDKFIAEEQDFEPIANIIDELITVVNGDSQAVDLKKISQLMNTDATKTLYQKLKENPADQEVLQQIIDELLDQHGTGRVLFRNTRTSVKGFPERKLHAYRLATVDAYKNFDSLCPEIDYSFEKNDDLWLTLDPRVEWLVNKSQELKDQKILIIASHVQTVLQLEKYYREKHGIHVAVFHEGMNLIERDQAAAWFADFDNGSQILLCSEIGSEGRNFQFSHHLLFFDLPDNPDLLEQRIGRLDRIGQTETINIHVPYLGNSTQETWFKWYHLGLNLFDKTNPAAYGVFQEFHLRIKAKQNKKNMDQLITDSRTMSDQLLQQMSRGRNRLLEYNSCRPEEADALKKLAEDYQQTLELERFMHRVFDAFNVNYEEHKAGSEILKPTDEMHGYFPHLLEEGMTITYDREIALANENIHFITWEHPMVSEVLDLILTQEKGNTTFAVLRDSGLKAGQVFVECHYHIEASGQSNMQLSRYLPTIDERLLMTEAGLEVADKITQEIIRKFQMNVPKHVALEVLKAKLPEIKTMLKTAEKLVQQKLPAIIESSTKKVKSVLQAEINRLENLAIINANVRPAEIEFLKQMLESSNKAIANTQAQLDSIRVLVTT